MQKFEDRVPVEFTNRGEKLFGILHLPYAETKLPSVLFCHGLAGNRIGAHRMYVMLSEGLARIGIASFRFDFRGSGDSEGEFGAMTLEGEIEDTCKALQLLTSYERIDPSRVGIFGRSFGGAVAIKATSLFKQIKSIALWAPVFNASQWEQRWEIVETQSLDELQRHELMSVNGQLPSVEFYKELFAMSLGEDLQSLSKTPFLHIHGEQDPIVDIEHAKMYEQAREEAAGPSKFIRLAHSDHDFTHPEEKLHAMHETCQWFAKTL